MRMLKQFGFAVWYLFVAGYVALMLMWSTGLLKAQPVQQVQITDLERRVLSLEALNFDHRLTVIETRVDEILGQASWEKLTTGGTALLILERLAVATFLKKKKEGGAQ